MTPKARFLQNKPAVGFWLNLVADPLFRAGLDASLLQLEEALRDTDELSVAASKFYRLRGAKELERILLSLPLPAVEQPEVDDLNLRSNVRRY